MLRAVILEGVAATLLVAACAVSAQADLRTKASESRPFIIDVGEPYSISPAMLQREADENGELSEYLDTYGAPDYAEIQDIVPTWPWASYEVRLYYLQRNLELDYGRVYLSPAAPNFGSRKFVSTIPPEKRHQIEVILEARRAPAPVQGVPSVAPAPQPSDEPTSGGLTEALVARIEAAAERAAVAADRAAEQSEA